jgi:methylated-DNA-protein-cysteine methyltransferase-like protein
MKTDPTFFDKVHDLARLIPKGRVCSYGAIAKAIGTPKSARMVGWAMSQSFDAIPKVPAHRVVNRNGMLSGKHHFGSPDKMQKLLEAEGIKVENDKVVNFKEKYWDPLLELE